MSYAHTKRRKNIARFKREELKNGRSWQVQLMEIADRVSKNNDGPLMGSIQDILEAQ